MVRKTDSKNQHSVADNESHDRSAMSIDLPGSSFAPWTHGNNCPLDENSPNNGTGIQANPESQNIDYDNLSFKQLRELRRRIREPVPRKSKDPNRQRKQTRGEQALDPKHDELKAQLADYAYTLGIDISSSALRRLVTGDLVEIEEILYRGGKDGVIYRVSESLQGRIKHLLGKVEYLSNLVKLTST